MDSSVFLSVKIVYLFFIIAYFCLIWICSLDKRQDYLSGSFNLALILLGFCWNRENYVFLIVGLVLGLAVFFIVLFYAVYKPISMRDGSESPVQTGPLEWLGYLIVLCPFLYRSSTFAVIVLVAYLCFDRFVFYRKHHSIL